MAGHPWTRCRFTVFPDRPPGPDELRSGVQQWHDQHLEQTQETEALPRGFLYRALRMHRSMGLGPVVCFREFPSPRTRPDIRRHIRIDFG